jgi:hypothetical protein
MGDVVCEIVAVVARVEIGDVVENREHCLIGSFVDFVESVGVVVVVVELAVMVELIVGYGLGPGLTARLEPAEKEVRDVVEAVVAGDLDLENVD